MSCGNRSNLARRNVTPLYSMDCYGGRLENRVRLLREAYVNEMNDDSHEVA